MIKKQINFISIPEEIAFCFMAFPMKKEMT